MLAFREAARENGPERWCAGMPARRTEDLV